MTGTLFPLPPVAADEPSTAEQMLERKRARRRAAERPRGHAAIPGTGPDGETCRSCAHMVRLNGGARPYGTKYYLKCALMQAAWTRSARTDVRAKSPACKLWERRT